MLFFLQSQDGSQESACISSYVKGKRLDGGFFAVLEGEKCGFEVYMYVCDSERRWALVRCIGV